MCGSIDLVRLYGVCVDGEPLRMQLPLCEDCGERFLIAAGKAIGELFVVSAPKGRRTQ